MVLALARCSEVGDLLVSFLNAVARCLGQVVAILFRDSMKDLAVGNFQVVGQGVSIPNDGIGREAMADGMEGSTIAAT